MKTFNDRTTGLSAETKTRFGLSAKSRFAVFVYPVTAM